MADAPGPSAPVRDADARSVAALRLAEQGDGIKIIVEEEGADPESDATPDDDEGPARRSSRGAGRHSGREVALQVLYALDLGKRDFEYADPGETALDAQAGSESDTASGSQASLGEAAGRRGDAFDRIAENFEVPPAAIEFARELVDSVVTRAERLDTLIGGHSRNWRVPRMAAVDRNVLRIAVFELSETETPIAVVIDEAVDLARRFGSDTSPAFVNGVLDSVAKEVRAA